MHVFQSHILRELVSRNQARYSELKPSGIESNKFIYHLKKLVGEGMITKSGGSYRLTASGKRYVSRLSLKSFQIRTQPKIVSVLIVQNARGEYLLMTSKRQPLYDRVSFPYGKLHYGESVAEAATRELKEKTGLTAQLTHCGDAYMAIREGGELVCHMLCHVFYGKDPKGNLIPEHKTHLISWGQPTRNASNEFLPEFAKLNHLRLASKSRFFVELAV